MQKKITDIKTLLRLHLRLSSEHSYGYECSDIGFRIDHSLVTADESICPIEKAIEEMCTGEVYEIRDRLQYKLLTNVLGGKAERFYNPNVNHYYYKGELNVLMHIVRESNDNHLSYFVSDTPEFKEVFDNVKAYVDNVQTRFYNKGIDVKLDFFHINVTEMLLKADSIENLGDKIYMVKAVENTSPVYIGTDYAIAPKEIAMFLNQF